MKRLLCLSALIVYVFACCPSSTTKPPTPIAKTVTVQPSTETLLPTDTAPSRLTAKVTASALNMRAGPGTDYTIVGKLGLDDSVEVVGRNAASDWLQIVYPANSDGRAWIAAAYAELTGLLATVPEVSAPTPGPPTATPMPIDTPTPLCTGIRFGEALVDDIDEIYHEGTEFSNVGRIVARFNCYGVSYDQIGFDWYHNGEFLCTYGNRDVESSCTRDRRASLIGWTGQPRPFLADLEGKGGWPNKIAPGEYELIIYVDGEEATRGVITLR